MTLVDRVALHSTGIELGLEKGKLTGWTLKPLGGQLGDIAARIESKTEWSEKGGNYFPKKQEVRRDDFIGERPSAKAIGDVNGNPEIVVELPMPDLVQVFPGAPSLLRISAQVFSPLGELSLHDDDYYMDIDTGLLLDLGELLSLTTQVRSSYIHRFTMVFYGYARGFLKPPVVRFTIRPSFPNITDAQPSKAHLYAFSDWISTRITRPGMWSPEDFELDPLVTPSLRKQALLNTVELSRLRDIEKVEKESASKRDAVMLDFEFL